jgi:hypothetical protein
MDTGTYSSSVCVPESRRRFALVGLDSWGPRRPMRARVSPVEALVTLPRLPSLEEQRASWRQAITALGNELRVTGPPPLDDVDPAALVEGVQVALGQGLCDELDWLGPEAAAVALYELTSALPAGRERRELGRRVFARLYEGRAATFAAVATRMALGSGRSLEATTLRARIYLVFDLPVGTAVNADALALTLVSRRELFERWILGASTGALPARRMAAKLLEFAAREATGLALEGDPYPRQLLVSDAVRPSFERLLADREPLVWRHAAVARGLLATVDGKLESEVEAGMDPALTPTAWRRAAVSLVAMVIGDPEEGLKRCRGWLDGELVRRDPGMIATMVWGLPRVVEAEPDAAEELLDRLCATRRPEVAEAVAELLGDVVSPTFGVRPADALRRNLGSRTRQDGPLVRTLSEQAVHLLNHAQADQNTVHAAVRRALSAFENTGARAAFDLALGAVQIAQREIQQIETLGAHEEASLLDQLTLLADLDAHTLERSRLVNLLLLGRRPGDNDASVPEIERLYDAIGNWVLDAEEQSDENLVEWTQLRALAQQRHLRTLLHLVDLETLSHSETEEAGLRVKGRARRTIQLLLKKLATVPDSSVHRILCATLARSFDAAVREGVAEPSDILLLVADSLTDQETISAIAEASTDPEVRAPIAAYDRFLAGGGLDGADDDITGSTGGSMPDETPTARGITRLSQGLGAGGSYRADALRQVVLKLGRALEAIAGARGLAELVYSSQSGVDPLADLGAAADALRQLLSGAKRRVVGVQRAADTQMATEVAPLGALVARAAAGVPMGAADLGSAVSRLVSELPPALGGAIAAVVRRLEKLPVAPASELYAIPLEKRRAALPDWLMPRRTIGAFYVVRALGSGGVSSVFVARRVEERNDKKAEHFALKVPRYDPTTARKLTEAEFLGLFREEAGALLALPHHPNLARFVTFDLAARPKPILVMELIRGMSLDRLVRNRSLTTQRALEYLAGVLSGLEAMHMVGVGHLDLKPSNIILRNEETPVLVDFGLSGRQLRPGCGTLEYAAPEILGVVPPDCVPAPAGTDIYAFACVAFELLTGQLLFDAEDETALMSQQVGHDGWPPKLARLAAVHGLRDLAVILAACLRRDPRDRPDAVATSRALGSLYPRLQVLPWPLSLRRTAAA